MFTSMPESAKSSVYLTGVALDTEDSLASFVDNFLSDNVATMQLTRSSPDRTGGHLQPLQIDQ